MTLETYVVRGVEVEDEELLPERRRGKDSKKRVEQLYFFVDDEIESESGGGVNDDVQEYDDVFGPK